MLLLEVLLDDELLLLDELLDILLDELLELLELDELLDELLEIELLLELLDVEVLLELVELELLEVELLELELLDEHSPSVTVGAGGVPRWVFHGMVSGCSPGVVTSER